jgi:uncharacterized protein (TIGR02466 family)
MVTWESLFPTPLMRANNGGKFAEPEHGFFTKMQAALHRNVANLRSANTHILDAPEMQRIRSFIEEHINQYAWKVISANPNHEFYITQSWLNFTKPGESHHRHTHTNSLISGVLYIAAKKEMDSICFYRDSASQRQVLASNDQLNAYNTSSVCIGVSAGDLLLFPSNLTHGVNQTTGEHTRISLAFNTFVRGELGSEDRLNRLCL